MLLGDAPLAHFLVDLAEAVPGVVVATVCGDGGAICVEGFLELFVGDVFVALEGEAICEGGVELRGPLEAFEGLFVFALQGEGVPYCAPCLRRESVDFNKFVGEVSEFDLGF